MPPNNDIFMLRDKERQRKKAVSLIVSFLLVSYIQSFIILLLLFHKLLVNRILYQAHTYLQERIKQRSLKVHEKMTYATKINFKTSDMIRPADSDEEMQKSDEDDGRAVAVKDDPQFTLAVTRGNFRQVFPFYACASSII